MGCEFHIRTDFHAYGSLNLQNGFNRSNSCNLCPMNLLRSIRSESYKRGNGLFGSIQYLFPGGILRMTIIIARYFGSNIKTDIYFFVFGTMLLFSAPPISTRRYRYPSRCAGGSGRKRGRRKLQFFSCIYTRHRHSLSLFMYFFGTGVWLISKFPEADITQYRIISGGSPVLYFSPAHQLPGTRLPRCVSSACRC